MFPLGGLAGFPFTGQTGWGAFSSHCPADGHIVILFAPHVGIDKDGNVGKINRPGQDFTSTACGAAIGAFNAVKTNSEEGNFAKGYKDHQMDCIKHLLLPHVKEIENHENVNVSLVYKMYEILENFLKDITHMNFGGSNSKLALIGGIMINCDGDGTDMFLPLNFELKSKDGKTQNFFKECFPQYLTPNILEGKDQ